MNLLIVAMYTANLTIRALLVPHSQLILVIFGWAKRAPQLQLQKKAARTAATFLVKVKY